MTELRLEDNFITDISALAGLTNLPELRLQNNNITDISAIAGLTNLTGLWLEDNFITDISALAGLTNLTKLRLQNNTITDISAIAGLTNLTVLWLWGNSISDLSPLVANTGLGSGDRVDVRGNFLNAAAIDTHIPELQNRRVWVLFDEIIVEPGDIAQTVDIPDPNLRAVIENARGKASGDPITVADMLTLTGLSARNANITDLTGLEYATNLTELNLESNSISDLSPLVANTGLESGDRIGVRGNFLNAASINTHIPELQNRGVRVEFDNIVVEPGDIAQTVDIPDPNLRAAVEDARGKASGDPITVADMLTLTELNTPNANISDLTGLEYATNLTRLYLGSEYVETEERYINSNSDLISRLWQD